MKTRPPTADEIDALLAFLPRLHADGLKLIKKWNTKSASNVLTLPWPEYAGVVPEFFEAAGREWWTDHEYVPASAGSMLMNEEAVRSASLDEINTMLTYCVRGERFCDGHWAAMVKDGHVRRLLERLASRARRAERAWLRSAGR